MKKVNRPQAVGKYLILCDINLKWPCITSQTNV